MRTRRYRNRRIGDFLKELHLVEGRNTGISTAIKAIKKNGSPLPTLLTDEDRSFFSVIIPIHDVFAEKGIEHVKVKTKRRSKNELKELILEALDEINLLVKEARKNFSLIIGILAFALFVILLSFFIAYIKKAPDNRVLGLVIGIPLMAFATAEALIGIYKGITVVEYEDIARMGIKVRHHMKKTTNGSLRGRMSAGRAMYYALTDHYDEWDTYYIVVWTKNHRRFILTEVQRNFL